MADPAMSVTPYWELTFDADGDVSGPERDRLLAEAPRRGVRDLVVFAHGWNNDRSGATRLYSSFFAPFPRLAPSARIGYVGVVWPSMRFCDEPIPDFPRSAAAEAPRRPVLDKDTRHALLETFPGRGILVEQLARGRGERPRAGAGKGGCGRGGERGGGVGARPRGHMFSRAGGVRGFNMYRGLGGGPRNPRDRLPQGIV
ncbi:hypothetical protein ACFV5G_39500, partial [Streptomyces sp. NPDC059766]